MQHTTKYKFNLIETSDTFSPEALNANAQAVEDALLAHKAETDGALKSQKLEWQAADDALKAADTALSQTVAANKKEADSADAALAQADSAIRAEFAAADAALSQTVAANKTALEAADAAIRTAMGSGGKTCRVAYGSYTGDGRFGQSSPKSLSFDFTPYLVIVNSQQILTSAIFGTMTLVRGCNGFVSGTSSYGNLTVAWTGNGVSWYTDYGDMYQFNLNKYQYYYVAFGY